MATLEAPPRTKQEACERLVLIGLLKQADPQGELRGARVRALILEALGITDAPAKVLQNFTNAINALETQGLVRRTVAANCSTNYLAFASSEVIEEARRLSRQVGDFLRIVLGGEAGKEQELETAVPDESLMEVLIANPEELQRLASRVHTLCLQALAAMREARKGASKNGALVAVNMKKALGAAGLTPAEAGEARFYLNCLGFAVSKRPASDGKWWWEIRDRNPSETAILKLVTRGRIYNPRDAKDADLCLPGDGAAYGVHVRGVPRHLGEHHVGDLRVQSLADTKPTEPGLGEPGVVTGEDAVESLAAGRYAKLLAIIAHLEGERDRLKAMVETRDELTAELRRQIGVLETTSANHIEGERTQTAITRKQAEELKDLRRQLAETKTALFEATRWIEELTDPSIKAADVTIASYEGVV